MTDDRKSGLALIAGAAGTTIAMAFHPTGHDLLASASESMTHINVAVHAWAMVSLPLCFLGTTGLSQRLASPNRLALTGLAIYGFAIFAVMNAAVFSGLAATEVARQITAAATGSADVWRIAFRYNGDLNQAFALVYIVASSTAIVLWSLAMLRSGVLSRGLGVYGCTCGLASLVAVLLGHHRLQVHGFGGFVFLTQAIWMVVAGSLLWNQPVAPSGQSITCAK